MAIKVGFVGCGGMNSAHMNNLKDIKGVQLAAFADPMLERAEEKAAQYGGVAYKSWEKMIGESGIDACYVAVPPFAHEGQEILAASKGIHLFVEKPVAIDMAYAKKVIKEIDKAGVISTAGFQDRYQDIVAKIVKLLDKNKPGLIMGYWIGGLPGVMWWRNKKMSGGQAVEQTIHTFDMARYLFGEVKAVHAVYSKGLMKHIPKYTVEDASAVNLTFKSGLCGTIFSGCFLNGWGKVGLDMWCPDMKIEYSGRSQMTVTEPGKDPETAAVGNDFLAEIDKTFVKAIQKNDQSLLKSNYADAAASLKVVLAANESMETGQAVKV
jgi:predicted dehydrogenase